MFIIEISQRNDANLRTPISATIQCKDMQELEGVLESLPGEIHSSENFEELCKRVNLWR